jgi:hypothetical protein
MSQAEKIAKLLNISKEQAEQVIADDKAIDRNEPMPFDLPKEKEKLALKFARGERKKPITFSKTPRKRQENTDKALIIAEICEFLSKNEPFFIHFLAFLKILKMKVR